MASFGVALTDRRSGETVPRTVWPLLDGSSAARCTARTWCPARSRRWRIGEVADIVILTNLGDEPIRWRVEQLAGHGIRHESLQPGRQGRAVRAR